MAETEMKEEKEETREPKESKEEPKEKARSRHTSTLDSLVVGAH